MATKVFGDYSECYSALYQDKDYAGEARFVLKRLHRHGAVRKDLLELGCGTGSYTRLFAKDFNSITGVDLSADMLKQAVAQNDALDAKAAAKITYAQGDARTLKLARKFDVVTALFHVMCYQVEHSDLVRAIATMSRHLKPGGLIFFDFWSGPGVLHCPPENRVKKVETAEIVVTRKASPKLDPNRNSVLVTYDIDLLRKQTGRTRSFREKHHVRYLFKPELVQLCHEAGLEVVEFGEWMTGKTPTLESWTAYLIARK